jgi:hypothetical protein
MSTIRRSNLPWRLSRSAPADRQERPAPDWIAGRPVVIAARFRHSPGRHAQPSVYPPTTARVVEQAIAAKNVRVDLDALLALDGEVRAMKSEVDELRRQRNEISAGSSGACPPTAPRRGPRRCRPQPQRSSGAGREVAALDALHAAPRHPLDGAPVGRTRAPTSSSAPKALRPLRFRAARSCRLSR